MLIAQPTYFGNHLRKLHLDLEQNIKICLSFPHLAVQIPKIVIYTPRVDVRFQFCSHCFVRK